jgi:protein O-mannosyl-transferase
VLFAGLDVPEFRPAGLFEPCAVTFTKAGCNPIENRIVGRQAMTAMNRSRLELLILVVLFAGTLLLYWPLRNHDFINYDDNRYVTENPHVQAGWTAKGFRWALTSTMHGHWHPLTWLSHMTDVQVFGLNPAGHHLVSLFFHLANTLLLFLALKGMTGAPLRSAFVAALFALHPLHVETVAWIADRKDLLSAFFWILGLMAYTRYCRRPHIRRYLLVVTAFVFGLLAKTMVVTLPLVLLLLDYWPLERLRFGRA